MEPETVKRIKISETEEKKVVKEKQSDPAEKLTLQDVQGRFKDTYLEKMKFSSFSPLLNRERSECSKCGSMRMYYCYNCEIPMIEGTP